MEERTAIAGGRLEMASTPGRTRVHVWLPVERPAPAGERT
jgi:hypothetical protein